jgi:hypothetical protein
MRKVIALLLAASLCAGCASTRKVEPGFIERYAGSKKLARAVELMEKGNSTAAARELSAICTSAAVPGVTDEALFRLALLSLKPTAERPVSGQAQQLLKRLRKEYPASPWTLQAAQLNDLLNLTEELKQQNRGLKATNQALAKEVSEYNKVIKQLKALDLELEQNRR